MPSVEAKQACESCIEAAMKELEEFGEDEVEWQVANDVAIGLGRDLPDHTCDAVETEGEVKCACGCRS